MKHRLKIVLCALLIVLMGLSVGTALCEEVVPEETVLQLEAVDLSQEVYLIEDFFLGGNADGEPLSQTFPDDIFRDYVLSNFDLDGDGAISNAEAGAVTAIGISGLDITSLKDIERFGRLKVLKCSDDAIEGLNLIKNPSLSVLFEEGNKQ